jgi:Uma2 family endonuclease
MYPASTKAADGLPRRAFSADDVSRMIQAGILCESERIELIEGDIVVLEPKPSGHDFIKNVLGMTFVRGVPDGLIAGIATTLQLADDVLVDPDIAIFSDRVFKRPGEDYFARPRPNEILLVVEIVATAPDYDRDIKARLYARFGVPEFWLIDPYERITWVHTGPNGEKWSSIVERSPTDVLTARMLPDLPIRLADIK